MSEKEKQYNVLIVDDEIFIRTGLTDIFSRNYPNWNLIGSAASYQEAYELFLSHPIDLLITDIQMPEKNGLELIEELRRQDPHLEIMIISGYDNFAYARRAMSNKVVHYLLKPIDLEEFHAAILQIEQSLSHRESAYYIEEIRNIQYTSSTINDLLNGNISAEHVLTPLLCDELLPYVLLGIDLYQDNADISSGRAISSLQTEIYDLLKVRGSAHFSRCLIFFRNKHFWNLILPGNETAQISAFAADLKNELYSQLALRASFGQSCIGHDALHFADCFRQSYIAARTFLIAPSHLALYDYPKETYADAMFYDTDTETRILNMICTGSFPDSAAALELFFDHLFSSRPDIFMLTRAVQRLSYSIMKNVEKSFALDNIFLELFETLQNLDGIHTKQQLLDLSLNYIRYCCSLFQTLFSNRQSRIVQYVMQFISEHYYEDLSLDVLAGKVEVSPNYLSTHFKAETGMNVVEYLTFIRLEKAKDLLQNSHAKIHQIADTIGYHDAKYFNRIFKKNIGVTPNEYRNISSIR